MEIKRPDGFYEVRQITSIKDLLESNAELYGDRPAFLIKKEKAGEYSEINYKLLKNDVDALGTKLIDMGLEGSKIALIGENCYEWMTTYLAVVNGVGIIVPLDKELNKDEIQKLLNTSGCKAIFFTDTFEEAILDYEVQYKVKIKIYGDRTDIQEKQHLTNPEGDILNWENLVDEGEKLIASGFRYFSEKQVDPEKMSMLLFSSGTTGNPKGVMLSHRNIVSNIMDVRRIVAVYPEDRTLSILPIHHTFESTIGILTILYSGGSIAFYEGLKYVSKNLAEARATILVGVPLIFESIYAKIWKQAEKSGKAGALKKAIKINRFLKSMGISAEKKLFSAIYETFGGRLRMMVTGAAAIDPNVCRGFESMGIRVVQGYGLTECAPLVTGTPDFGDTYAKAGSVGPVVASGELRIINKDEDGIGEIIFKGPNVMLGYYQMQEETDKVMIDGWFHTGDLGFLDDNGWLYLTGRKKNVIVTKTGKNIYPEEVEFYVNRNKYIQESLVHGIEDGSEEGTIVGVQVIPAYDVIFEEFGPDFSEENISALIRKTISEINDKLPIYKRIRKIAIRKDEFIKTTTKKIQRHKNI